MFAVQMLGNFHRGLSFFALLVAAFVFDGSERLAANEPPNILIIMADDCTYSDLPMYGGENAKTPNLDRLAAQSLVFNRAYLSEAMCQPCRAELYSGQYPMRNGCAWNHSSSRPTTTSLPQHLEPLGYRVGLAGKVHVLPPKAFPFESVAGFDKNCVRNPTTAHDLSGVSEFISREKQEPFCLVVALVEPHVPWVMGDPSQYPPAKLKLPPNLADTERTRDDYSRYLAEITYMDSQIGDLLQVLEASGKADDTLVLFTSEQGAQFPGCKWTNWDTGLHTALVARWPGKVSPGIRTDALVQYADVAPTLVELAGGNPKDHQYDGTSFAGVLTGESDEHRQFVYGVHNNIPEGPAYPTRTISDGTFRLIENLTPDAIYIEKHLMGSRGDGSLNNPYWATWVWDSAESPETYNLVKRYTSRPAKELYKTSDDPYELTNLADLPEYSAIQNRLETELERWMNEQGDPGIAQDTKEAHQAAKKGKHLYFPKD
ncbi:sulfatase [Thalassoglobus sp. JC818]|uniref:sulfatase family protein n=1 Tax=Thalassoglobus sp. JC818 TaxID=3232136 RepID=UPI00345AD10A